MKHENAAGTEGLDLRTIAYFNSLEGKLFYESWVRGEKWSSLWLADCLVCNMIDYSWSTGSLKGFKMTVDEFVDFCGDHLYAVQRELWLTGFDIKRVSEPCDCYKYIRIFGHVFRYKAKGYNKYVTFTATKVNRADSPATIPYPIKYGMNTFHYA